MKLFVAIFPPQYIRTEMHEYLSRYLSRREYLRLFRPTPLRNIHMTLKFLGEVPDDTPGIISPALKRNVGLHSRFSLSSAGIGGFPSDGRARVLWMGTAGDVESLVSLQESVENAAKESGFPPEDRDFVPHFTIGRSRRPHRITSDDPGLRTSPVTFEVGEVLLVESVASSSGVEYEIVEEYELLSGVSG